MKIKILETELKVGSLSRVISSVNILPFRYELFCDGVNITCQLCDENNCVCLEENIFINKDKLNKWCDDDNYLIQELLIRLGLKEYTIEKQGNKNIDK